MLRDEGALLDILRAAHLVGDFLKDIDHEQFEHDLKTQSAVLNKLMVLGDAVKRLSDDFRNEHDDVAAFDRRHAEPPHSWL